MTASVCHGVSGGRVLSIALWMDQKKPKKEEGKKRRKIREEKDGSGGTTRTLEDVRTLRGNTKARN